MNSEVEREAARRILETVPMVMRTVAAAIQRTEQPIAPAHLRLLFVLSKHPFNLSQLAEIQSVSPPSMSKTVAHVVQHGWIRRTRDTKDRRCINLEITEAGHAVLADIKRQAEQHVADVIHEISTERQQTLLEGLEIMESAFSLEPSEPELKIE